MPRRQFYSTPSSQWVFHKDLGSGNRFGLKYNGLTGLFTFQKSSAAYSAFYTSGKSFGDDVLIAIAYDIEDVRIYEDGIKQYTRTPYETVEELTTGLYLSDTETDLNAINAPIAFFRIDDAKLSDTEIAAASDLWLNDDERVWQLFFEGRTFEIDNINVKLTPGYTDEFSGTATVIEVDNIPQATNEEP